MRVLIIEDELPSQRMLKDLITVLRPDWEVVACTGSVADTVEWLRYNKYPELIFSDIQLTDGTCFEIFEQIKLSSFVIFTTAFDEYAIRAFKVNSVDYILKPVSKDVLNRAIEKFERMTRQDITMPDIPGLMESLLTGKIKYRSRLMVNVSDGFVKLDVDNIAFFYSSNKITSAITFDKKHYVIAQILEKLEMQLDPAMFFRANRQFILNINSLTKVETWFNGKLITKTRPEADEKIIISRERSRAFKNWIDQ